VGVPYGGTGDNGHARGVGGRAASFGLADSVAHDEGADEFAGGTGLGCLGAEGVTGRWPLRWLAFGQARWWQSWRVPLSGIEVPYDPGPGRVRAGPGSRSLSPRAARYLPSTAAMKPSGSTRLIVSELTLLLRNSVLGCREV
jgi:hypothetical protein